MCPFCPRFLEEQGRLGCREQRVWGTEVWMGWIRAMGSTAASRGFISPAPCSWQGKNGCRILGEFCFLWAVLLVFCVLIL